MLSLRTTSIAGKYLNNAHWIQNTNWPLVFLLLFLFSTMYFTFFKSQIRFNCIRQWNLHRHSLYGCFPLKSSLSLCSENKKRIIFLRNNLEKKIGSIFYNYTAVRGMKKKPKQKQTQVAKHLMFNFWYISDSNFSLSLELLFNIFTSCFE